MSIEIRNIYIYVYYILLCGMVRQSHNVHAHMIAKQQFAIFVFHPFTATVCPLASLAIKCETFTSNITNYYYTCPRFRCAARVCADAMRPAALHCSILCIRELCLRPNPCGIECTDCTAQYTLPEMGGSIESPEPPLATGLI